MWNPPLFETGRTTNRQGVRNSDHIPPCSLSSHWVYDWTLAAFSAYLGRTRKSGRCLILSQIFASPSATLLAEPDVRWFLPKCSNPVLYLATSVQYVPTTSIPFAPLGHVWLSS